MAYRRDLILRNKKHLRIVIVAMRVYSTIKVISMTPDTHKRHKFVLRFGLPTSV